MIFFHSRGSCGSHGLIDLSAGVCARVISLLLIVLWCCFAVSISAGGSRAVAVETKGQRGALVFSSSVLLTSLIKVGIVNIDIKLICVYIVVCVCVTDAAAGTCSDKTEGCEPDSVGCYRTQEKEETWLTCSWHWCRGTKYHLRSWFITSLHFWL